MFRKRPTLAGQLLASQLTVILLVLAAVAGVSLAQSQAVFAIEQGRRVTQLAESLASSDLVRSRLPAPAPAQTLAPEIQSSLERWLVSSVTIADAAGEVVASTNPLLIGTELPLGPGVLDGRGWRGEIEIGGRTELVGQAPVLGPADGDDGPIVQLGVAVVGQEVPSPAALLAGDSPDLLLYLGIASALGIAGSWLLARRIKRQTFGMEPREIAGLAEHREAMLYGIAEGVVALDPQHRVTLVNDVARRLLDLPETAVGALVDELGLTARLRDVLTGTAAGADQVVLQGNRVLVVNRMPVAKDGRSLGSVATLRDRTELAQLERDLGSFRSTAEALRAQAHEFDNKLHTISGLIQIGEQDEVVAYIDALNRHRQSLELHIAEPIRDKAIAALLMAKSAQAAERRVRLDIVAESALAPLDPEDSADVGTVLGNLVDNAVEAAAGHARDAPLPRRSDTDAWVAVAIVESDGAVRISVHDSGPGVPPETAGEVFEHGYTTKAAAGEHGIGLALTKLVCEHHGGSVALEHTEQGARFTAVLPLLHEPAPTPSAR
ncbi:sensor histidine kinase regulating citrate/malate metabolism [Glycomyces algeriensis]|uniref:histidine kinase n=1 Tax=Glycomyces algeriensis TaxID=256037 RepID=A0A9W6G4Y7_9ACTN|nr:ATP-binding protein [Glycomyces algeriensis]MDA1367167.1 ATP-binding protein [Glycomyces algeriensis]MDR7353450.1 sensor histidine kinase regulating citrate/malate metabolism [Glycomyces algeriensis]GLI41149.1 ATPase [Glycomyces algeriensis]